MKNKLLIVGLLISSFASAQIRDTGVLRDYVNANIVPNGTRSVTAQQLNTIFNGYLNIMTGYKNRGVDTVYAISDSVIGYKINGIAYSINIKGAGVSKRYVDSLIIDKISAIPVTKNKQVYYSGVDINVTVGGLTYDHFKDTSLIGKSLVYLTDVSNVYSQANTIDSIYDEYGNPAFPNRYYFDNATGDVYLPWYTDGSSPLFFYVIYNEPGSVPSTGQPNDIQLEVGVTAGAPTIGSNTYQNNALKNRRIRFYLDGQKLSTANTASFYYTFNSATGTITLLSSSGSTSFQNHDVLQIEFY